MCERMDSSIFGSPRTLHVIGDDYSVIGMDEFGHIGGMQFFVPISGCADQFLELGGPVDSAGDEINLVGSKASRLRGQTQSLLRQSRASPLGDVNRKHVTADDRGIMVDIGHVRHFIEQDLASSRQRKLEFECRPFTPKRGFETRLDISKILGAKNVRDLRPNDLRSGSSPSVRIALVDEFIRADPR